MPAMTITARIGRTPGRTSCLESRNPISGARAARLPRSHAHRVWPSLQQLSRRLPAGRGRLAITARRARSPSPTTTAHAAENLKASAMRVNAHTPKVVHTDYLVIGSGIAGLSYALSVADSGRVAIVTKDRAKEGSTRYAQGGICAVLDPLDSVESHAHDTMVAGDFLCDQAVVDLVCREGTNAVLDLVAMGASFDRTKSGQLHLTREGGHAHKRVVHAADLTGAEIERTLLARVKQHPNIQMYESHLATDLVTEGVGAATWCLGADAFERTTGREVRFLALSTMIASGGSGHVYPSTTNPVVATGDGIAMAARAGAAIGNMEFMQFHPTSFYAAAAPYLPEQQLTTDLNRAPVFLISEAVRGEGGVLLDGSGSRFMDQYDVRGELAPRDVVARAIAAQCKKRDEPCAFLDISHKPAADVRHHFPNIAAHCAEHGLDITRDPIPVTPAMHYTCGGVRTDQNAATNLKGLFVCGEAAYTGLHGANRLASNSLLEGLVFGRGAATAATAHAALASSSPRVEALHRAAACREARHLYIAKELNGHEVTASTARDAMTEAALVTLRTQTQDTMWEHAGIVRTTASLRSALQRIRELSGAAAELPVKGCSPSLAFAWYEAANLLTVAELVVASALQRKESRGLHFTLDFPEKVERERRPTLIHHPLRAARVLDAVHAKRINRSALLPSKSISKSLTKPAPAALPFVEARVKATDKGLVPK